MASAEPGSGDKSTIKRDRRGWIGVDLDATLAYYDGFKGPEHIGEPIPQMVDRVKRVNRMDWPVTWLPMPDDLGPGHIQVTYGFGVDK